MGIKSGQDGRGHYHDVDGIPTDGLAGLQTRLSMQSRRSGEHRRSASWSLRSPVLGSNDYSRAGGRGENAHMLHSYDVEANPLHELAEDSDEETSGSNHKRTSFDDGNGRRVTMNGGSAAGGSSNYGPPRRARTVDSEIVNTSHGKSFDQKR